MLRKNVLLAGLIGICFIASCSTLEIGIERTSTPDLVAIGTLSHLILRGTQLSITATNLALATPQAASTGTINGRICYPGGRIPEMLLYFRELSTNQLSILSINENQSEYTLSLLPGKYYAFAWVIPYQVGGLYSYAVPCGLSENCIDHSPLVIDLEVGETSAGVDICDWAIPADQLPVPLGFVLPK